MSLDKRIEAFATLGKLFRNYFQTEKESSSSTLLSKWSPEIKKLIQEQHIYNAWFTKKNVNYALNSWANLLTHDNLQKWINPYREQINKIKKISNIGVIMAGNIPLVGMHDFISVLITGNRFVGKLSSKDDLLLKLITNILCDIDSSFSDLIRFTDNLREHPDAIIATGSNNSARYFEYYFGKFPRIVRNNRNSISVLTGHENETDILNLANDIFTYFGLGCRNVSKLYVPEGYTFDHFFNVIEPWHILYQHNKYANNYDYHQSVYLMNKIPFLDNGFVLVKNDCQIYSPLSVIFYEYYSDITILAAEIKAKESEIQCIVTKENELERAIPFGKTQSPKLWDYADNINTLEFLIKLNFKGYDL
jgi:hypothetical protein